MRCRHRCHLRHCHHRRQHCRQHRRQRRAHCHHHCRRHHQCRHQCRCRHHRRRQRRSPCHRRHNRLYRRSMQPLQPRSRLSNRSAAITATIARRLALVRSLSRSQLVRFWILVRAHVPVVLPLRSGRWCVVQESLHSTGTGSVTVWPTLSMFCIDSVGVVRVPFRLLLPTNPQPRAAEPPICDQERSEQDRKCLIPGRRSRRLNPRRPCLSRHCPCSTAMSRPDDTMPAAIARIESLRLYLPPHPRHT